LDGVCGHHQIRVVTPCDSISIFGDGAGQKKIFISQRTVDLIAEDGRANVNEVLTSSPGTFRPLNSKHKVVERLDSRHAGKWNPAINDVILAH
jgi:hypothetical protein